MKESSLEDTQFLLACEQGNRLHLVLFWHNRLFSAEHLFLIAVIYVYQGLRCEFLQETGFSFCGSLTWS